MHLPDGFLTSELAIAADVGAAVAIGAALAAVRRTARAGDRLAAGSAASRGGASAVSGRLGLAAAPAVGAAVFAAQMLNVHVGGGTSGHLVGAVLACMLLGPSLGFLTVAVVLAVQALAFADGGLLALGANVLAMGGIGALAAGTAERVAGALGARGSAAQSPRGESPPARPLAAALAAAVALLVGAIAVGALLELSGTGSGAIGAMAETHVPIALIEGAVTAAVVALAAAWAPLGRRAILAGTVVLVAFAPLASTAPDGLERVAHDLGFAIQADAGAAFAPAADYAAPGIDGEAAATIAAGLLGVVLVAGALAAPALAGSRAATA